MIILQIAKAGTVQCTGLFRSIGKISTGRTLRTSASVSSSVPHLPFHLGKEPTTVHTPTAATHGCFGASRHFHAGKEHPKKLE